MLKYVQLISVIFIAASIAACGGSDTATTAATPIYDYVDSQQLSLADATSTLMGGAVKGGAISTKPSDYSYSVSTFTGIAGSAGFSNYSTTNGPPAMFSLPTDITTDGTNFYVADYANNAIRQVTDLGVVTTLQCTDVDTGDDTGFNLPFSLTTDGTNIYVVDAGSNTIRFIEIATKIVTTVGSTEGLAGSVDVEVVSPATTADRTLARFNRPTGITTDGINLYVADSGNSTIRRINIATKAVTTLAGTSGSVGSADGAPRIARFNLPQRITTDRTSLYVTDFNNRTVRQIDISTGTVTTLAGTPGLLDKESAGSIDGFGPAARFNQPNGITTDGINLYVTDKYQNTIRKIVISTGEVTTIAGIAIPSTDDKNYGIGGAVDSPGEPSFDTPTGITTNGTSLFVADTYNHTIRKIQ